MWWVGGQRFGVKDLSGHNQLECVQVWRVNGHEFGIWLSWNKCLDSTNGVKIQKR